VPDALTAKALVDRVLLGNRRAAGRVMSLIEDADPSVEAIVRQLYPHTGNAYLVGLTGPPGAGKSTLADELIRVAREQGRSVGIIAVDPNSPFSGGAILGDRIRMMRHSGDDSVFMRSMGARGHLGGLALATENVAMVMDAMGTDLVLLETVGVGQSELEVASAADTTVVVIPPGSGDGVQAIKAGIMEIADIFAVNKADHPQANRTVADIRELLRMETDRRPWTPPIVRTIATANEGVEDLWTRIERHRHFLETSGQFEQQRKNRLQREIVSIAERQLRRQVLDPRTDSPEFHRMLDLVVARKMDPYQVAEKIVPPQPAAQGSRNADAER
jgi:LAO/AO transport system kinase